LPDTAAVMESLADRLRALLHSPAVLVFLQQERVLQLQAVSTQAPHLALAVRLRFHRNELRSSLEIAARAVAAGESITVSIDGASHFGEDSPPGVLIASPFRTSRSQGAILVYPRLASPFTQEEKALVSALAGFGAVAIANAELCGMARTEAQELQHKFHQAEEYRRRAEALVTLALEMNTALQMPEFLRNFALHTGALLGGRAVALLLQSPEPDMVLMAGTSEVEDESLLRRVRQSIDAALPKYPTDLAFAPAGDML